MTDTCGCTPEAGRDVCDLPEQDFERPKRIRSTCPECGRTGKLVQGQTVKALLAVTLRRVQDTEYLFCGTRGCPIVYFTANGEDTFSIGQVRERVYQKEPESDDVLICYCFGHTAGEVRTASAAKRAAIVEDIDAGIKAGQCACDLRNPQGSCCLGNVRAMIRKLENGLPADT